MTTSTVEANGTWTTTDDALPTPAAWDGQHDGPVLLNDEEVLVAGGANALGASLDATARFTQSSRLWEPAKNLTTPRRLHSLTKLNDGTVLAVGGLNGSTGVATAERYDPEHDRWDPAGSIGIPRWGHSAALLPDGTVLVAGGTTARAGGGVTALRTARRYHPGDNSWDDAATMTDARTGHTAVLLADRFVLVVGGVVPVGSAEAPALAFCETYDADHDRWNPVGSLLRGRRHHRATALSASTVLVTGGTAPGSPGTAPFDPFSQRTVELFDLSTGTWTARRDMPAGRALHRTVPLGANKVLVIGGAPGDRDEAGFRSAFVFDNVANEWTPAAGLTGGRWSFAATALDEHRALVAGGVTRSGLAAADPAGVELTALTELFTDGGAGS